jgi:hypothetical protein
VVERGVSIDIRRLTLFFKVVVSYFWCLKSDIMLSNLLLLLFSLYPYLSSKAKLNGFDRIQSRDLVSLIASF